MDGNKEKLAGMLTNAKPSPQIKRGEALTLSTSAKTHDRTNAQTHNRVNRGYKLREDLIKDCKRLALEQSRKLYEVMEDALSEYLDRQKGKREE
jgi:hypothetical protein